MSGASSPFQSSTYRLGFSTLVLAVLLVVLGAHAISCLSISASAVGAADSQGDSSGSLAQTISALPASDAQVATPNGEAASTSGPSARPITQVEPRPCHAPSEPADTSCVASTPELPTLAAEPAESDVTVAALPDEEWTVASLVSAEVATPSPQELSISRT
ncbi:hypothetical protein [Lysinibacter cavernae]|uniref:Uncharacterized protein n=1 Tax=Lysinibacter cavernae TaxID=1640652 RepID=A0A7X5QZ16_9MICO|nr:hypothetical protein [Lysinibacter cavernae]NIH52623.1 hypothetical protein [Lysinibacter cavernae]